MTDDERRVLNAVYDESRGDTHRPVHPAALSVLGLSREDIDALTRRLVAEMLLECPHGGADEVYLTPAAVKTLTAAELD